MKKYIFVLLILVIAVAIALYLPELANGQPPPPPGKPQQTPIDGGLGILAAAGGAYAIKKLRDKSKE